MDVGALIDAIVRQTTVLLAQLATAGGNRPQLAHTANQVSERRLPTEATVESGKVLLWDRLDENGAILSEGKVAWDACSRFVTSGQMIRLYRTTGEEDDGLLLLTCNLDGRCEQKRLTLPGWEGGKLISLPNGMMATSTLNYRSVGMTMLDRDGSVVWHRSYPIGLLLSDVSLMYHEAFDELVVYGHGEVSTGTEDEGPQESFVLAVDTSGQVRWQLRRRARSAMVLGSMFEAEGGRLIGLLQNPDSEPTHDLMYYTIDATDCD